MIDVLEGLNSKQKEAVCHTDGPLLILAGAGSGKTKVITHRIAYLIEQGVKPYNIMAITFTNKAAKEMRERADLILGGSAADVWISTFHSGCVRILRKYIDRLGYTNNFSIYDSDDSKSLIREIIKSFDLDTKIYKDKVVASYISSAKNSLKGEDDLAVGTDPAYRKNITEIYYEYKKRLKSNNALDFDDLILKTVELLTDHEDVRNYYHNRLKYIMVDEYQDTNDCQFELVRLLAMGHNNICVVGDDDQSIYKFRGANIGNILEFEDQFKNAKVIKLEQNYRSTKTVLEAANAVIKNNTVRKDKSLWCENEEGDKIDIVNFDNGFLEADFIAGDIGRRHREESIDYNKFAILYRTNAQSRLIEEKLVRAGIPYKIVGGMNFYSRKEIKDILSYLRFIVNTDDDISLQRVINVPKRGIGATTVSKILNFALENDMPAYDAILNIDHIPDISERTARIVKDFGYMVESLRKGLDNSVSSIIEDVTVKTDYVSELEKENSPEAKERIENINEFISKAYDFERDNPEGTIGDFLEEVALVADIDSYDENSSYVTLMTLHSAKGLEFDNVYISGMEDGNFPSYFSITADDDSELEEERRLFYVGITRAKKKLVITHAKSKMIKGERINCKKSRFLDEVPADLTNIKSESFNIKKPVAKKERPSLVPKTKPYQSPVKTAFSSSPSTTLNYGKGDRVSHMKFGQGTVINIVNGGRDYEVTVDFDKFGVKKMFAGFAKLKKL